MIRSRSLTTRSESVSGAWQTYLAEFHRRQPGITEEILGTARDRGQTPYQWVVGAVPPDARVLDLACGSSPTLAPASAPEWVGVDRSGDELTLARIRSRRLVEGDAAELPVATATFDALVCSMALMLLSPLDACLREIGRVVRPGGTVAVLLPGGPAPLSARDVLRWTRLLLRLRVPKLSYPNDHALRSIERALREAGMQVAHDERRRFAHPLVDDRSARRFIDSLYLPRVHPDRVEAARRLAVSWTGKELGIPFRRLVMTVNGRS